ncbi:MAG: hypothetical protein JO125_14930 [Chloroflexi bacterium]|nr:hypothetical protein [Chloroflexota bacterium]
MAPQQQVCKVGKSTILVRDDEFADGYSNGLLAYPKDQEIPLTVEAIHQIIAESFLDEQHTSDWNIGYIVGAISGIREGNYLASSEGKEVQLGPILLRFNRWHFREGYCNGRLDYETSRDEQTSPHVLTAHDLLRYIAHRDSATDRYYFAEDELMALEETLGQFIGYFSAALFPKQQE